MGLRRLYDLIIGNIPGTEWKPRQCDKSTEAHEEDFEISKEEETLVKEVINVMASVETQVLVSEFKPDKVTAEELKKEQAADVSLKKCWGYSSQKHYKAGSIVRFGVFNGLLYRWTLSPYCNDGEEAKQLVVPVKLRRRVMEIAHDSILGDHLDEKQTEQRVLSKFFWPRCYKDIAEYCKCCEICQRQLEKVKVHKLGSAMVIQEFSTDKLRLVEGGELSGVSHLKTFNGVVKDQEMLAEERGRSRWKNSRLFKYGRSKQ